MNDKNIITKIILIILAVVLFPFMFTIGFALHKK